MSDQEKLLQEIKSLSDSIRIKNRALRMGIGERERFLEQTFKPVIEPIKDLSNEILKTKPKSEGELVLPFKEKEEELQDQDSDASEILTDKSTIEEEDEEVEEEEGEDVEYADFLAEPSEPSNISKLGTKIISTGELGRKYVMKMLHSSVPNRNYHVYGARLEKEGLMIGDNTLKVDNNDNIHIGNQSYKGTKGLFELLFKNKPNNYKKADLNTFRKICKDTNAHKKSYLPDAPIHRNRSIKYLNIISDLFPSSKMLLKKSEEKLSQFTQHEAKRTRRLDSSTTGKGLLKDTYKTNIIYYNDVNKLVERMRLIHEAMEAGHTGLGNEWVALVEELKNKGIIEIVNKNIYKKV